MKSKTIPSLVIGLGGTGKRALTHIKRRVFDTYGVRSLPWLRLLSIDADNAEVNSPPVISQITGEVIQLGNDEARVIDQSNAPLIISNLDSPENQHIKQWYPDKERNVDFPKAVRGSGQIRMFGRVGLYKDNNLHDTFRWLKNAAESISDSTVGASFPQFEIDSQLQYIYVVCSLCGGTGSGIFLDIAYMLRKIVGPRPETRRLIGMFVLPEVYEAVVPNEDIKRIQANTYAALRELDFLMHSPRRSFSITGKNDTLVDYARDIPPFDFAFFFGNKNRRGAILSERQSDSGKASAPDDRVAQYISEAVVTDVLSSVTDKCESAYSNMLRPGDPVKLADNSRKFHRSFSAVGVSSIKLLPIEHYRQLLIAKITDQVIDFLLRPDPEVTERVLAERFLNDHFSGLAERFALTQSVNEDPDYKEFDTKEFAEKFDASDTRAHAWDIFRQWAESVASETLDLNNHLSIESKAVNLWRATVERVGDLLEQSLRSFSSDPTKGFTFMREWLDELIRLSEIRRTAMELPAGGEEYREDYEKALRALETVEGSLLLTVERDTVFFTLWQLAAYYNNHLRQARSINLARGLYDAFITHLNATRAALLELEQGLREEDRVHEQSLATRIERLPDTTHDAILVDKSLVGKREVNTFLNFLLSPLWEGGNWEQDFPNLSQQKKTEITGELGVGLLAIALDTSLTADQRRERILEATRSFVERRLFNQLFPIDAGTGKLQAPRYTTADGKSILFKFAPPNMLQLMGRHSSPLWSVQTHQIASATSPMQFLSLNGTSAVEGLLNDLQAHIAGGLKATDIVLSGDEARLLIKQYDLLYALASLENIQDYENRYQATDRSENPLHTDLRFMAEPNPYLQWLTYQAPPPPPVPVCKEGHDIEEALEEGREYCPHCAATGKKTYIVPGKKLCPGCNQAIPEDSLRCPIDGYKFILPRLKCWGCQTRGKTPVRVVEYKDAERKQPKENFCPTCDSQWANQCPYCHKALDNLTMCTRTEECITEDRVILQCASCECPVRPDAKECPRCYEKLTECVICKDSGEPKRMLTARLTECPACHTAVAQA